MSTVESISILLTLTIIPICLYFVQKFNFEYYKLHKREPWEIKEWLRKKKWYDKFCKNMRTYHGENTEEQFDILNGKFDVTTISGAFPWKETPEGIEYWAKKEYQFLRWYYGQWIDFHLTK